MLVQEIIRESDGSTDRTSELVEQYQHERHCCRSVCTRTREILVSPRHFVNGAFLDEAKLQGFVAGDNAEPKGSNDSDLLKMIGKS